MHKSMAITSDTEGFLRGQI